MSSFYPYNPNLDQVMQSEVSGKNVDRGFVAHLVWSALEAVVADADGLLADSAVSADSVVELIPTAQPSCAKNITATVGGTAGSIKAVQVTVHGFDVAGNALEEDLPAFTVDTAGTVTGSKAFASVTKVSVPAMDGAGVTVSIGFGEKLGLPFKLGHDTLLFGSKAGTREATDPTLAVSSTVLASNTIDFNSALDGSIMHAYIIV